MGKQDEPIDHVT